jgi:diguanylate cyclase (GGDEF)-like protein
MGRVESSPRATVLNMSACGRLGRGGRPVAAAAVLGIAIVVGTGLLAVSAERQQVEVTRDAMAGQGLASANDEVLVSLLDAETGQRGFLLTGRDTYLVPYDEGVARLPTILARMDRFAAVLPEQRPAVARIRQLVDAKLQELDATIRLRRTVGSAATTELVNTDRGKHLMEELRAVQGGVAEQVTRQGRDQKAAMSMARARVNRVVAAAGVLLVALLVTMLGLLLGRGRAEQRHARGELQRQALTDELARLAGHDPLTGLANRRLLADRIGQALERACQDGTFLALFFVDVDHFKAINDQHGHAAGDEVLRSVARWLQERMRATDTLARVGGDEFVLLCEGFPDAAQALKTAAGLEQQITAESHAGGTGIAVMASVGVAVTDGRRVHGDDDQGAVTTDSLLLAADSAMYAAKEAGRGRTHVYDTHVARRRTDRVWLARDLRIAIDTGQLSVAYQPLVRLSDMATVAVEALARWTHPERGAIGPEVFIPVAEQTGLIVPLGELMLTQSTAQVADWNRSRQRAGLAPLGLNVNCSPRQLLNADLAATLTRVLADTGLPAALLTVEITEDVLVDAVVGAAAQLEAVAALGITLALDDFGTGYSSLSYLHRFPFDMIKVDCSFVAGLGQSRDAEAVLAAVVSLARALNRQVLAEGVETLEQARHVQRLGCDYAQGYLFGRPADAELVCPDRQTHHASHDQTGNPRSHAVGVTHSRAVEDRLRDHGEDLSGFH